MKNDATLVAEALINGPEAFGPIIHRFKDIVFGVALARVGNFHDAEDIAQTVFINAFECLDNLKDPCRLGAWLRSITIHRCINHLQRRPPVVNIEEVDEFQGSNSTPQTQLETKELREQVMAAVGRLSKVQRETVTLFYISGYSQQDIAAIQEVPLGTIKRRLHDARLKLKTEMFNVVEDTLRTEAPKEDFSERVFNLICRYQQPDASLWPWREVKEELLKIGIDGIEGLKKAMQFPHAPTRRFAVKVSRFIHNVAEATANERQEVIVTLLKEALNDSNNKVRKGAVPILLDLNIDAKRKRDEFVPLIIPLLKDPAKRVRWRVSYELQKWAAYVPLEAAALALADERDPGAKQGMGLLVHAIIDARENITA